MQNVESSASCLAASLGMFEQAKLSSGRWEVSGCLVASPPCHGILCVLRLIQADTSFHRDNQSVSVSEYCLVMLLRFAALSRVTHSHNSIPMFPVTSLLPGNDLSRSRGHDSTLCTLETRSQTFLLHRYLLIVRDNYIHTHNTSSTSSLYSCNTSGIQLPVSILQTREAQKLSCHCSCHSRRPRVLETSSLLLLSALCFESYLLRFTTPNPHSLRDIESIRLLPCTETPPCDKIYRLYNTDPQSAPTFRKEQ